MPPLSSLPSPFRAALGLAATILDEARNLPDKAIELPMLAVSRALKMTLRAQQRYTALAARGDEVLSGRKIGDEPPEWARFDEVDDVTADDLPADIGVDPAVDPIADLIAEPLTGPTGTRTRPAKTVHTPRTGTPSAFDAVADED